MAIHTALEARVEYLRAQLNERIDSFGKRSEDNWRWETWLRIGLIVFGAGATIMVGLTSSSHVDIRLHPTILKIGALVLTAAVTALATAESFFNPRALWIRYTGTRSALLNLKAELEYRYAADELSDEMADRIFDRYQAILSETNSDWATARRIAPEPPKALAAPLSAPRPQS